MINANVTFSDEVLTAYLDDEVDASTRASIEAALESDAALAGRLAALDIPLDTLRAVMDPRVLQAPVAPDMPVPVATAAPRKGRFLVPLALAASFAVGMVATTLLIPAPPAPQAAWLNAIASYQALYVTETLSSGRQDSDVSTAVLTRAGSEFGVTLGPATDLAGLDFRRAQMLGFKGKPLLQMAYLTDDGTPMALCLVSVGEADRSAAPTVMFDLAGTSWVKDGVGYFLIGGQDAAQIDALSNQIQAQI